MQWTDTLLAYSVLVHLRGWQTLPLSQPTPDVKHQFDNLLHEFCTKMKVVCLLFFSSLYPIPFPPPPYIPY